MIKYDLHCHTTFSDGRLAVNELLERATEKGVDILAITDHDTIDAILPAQEYIREHNLALELINGVEISTKWESFEIHIVGLGFTPEHLALTTLLSEQQKKREARAIEIGARLAKKGYENVYEDAQSLAQTAQITRAHFAQVLVQRGVAKNIQGVFNKFLARGKTGYVPSQWCDMKTAIEAIHEAGGVSVLAHPARYKMSNKWLRKLIAEFKQAGGAAMEVAQPQQAPTERQFLGRLSQEFGLLASQGSDFHFPMPWVDLGRNLYLPKDCQGVWRHWGGKEE